jgi:GAF domain-containing protein
LGLYYATGQANRQFGRLRNFRLCIPVLNAEKVVGTIDVESERPDAFDKETERLLEHCAILLQPLFAPVSSDA